MTGRLLLLTVFVGALFLSATSSAGEDKLLSRNATYKLTGAGYVYSGQIQPGVNDRAKSDGMVDTPLTETTDSGDDLIDGDPGDDSVVYTPWVWNQPGKQITVEMTLPAESRVSRVHVKFPEDVQYRPEVTHLDVRADDGSWERVGTEWIYREGPVEKSPTSAAFELDGRACRELKITVGGHFRHVGVTEIEVWGDGPTRSARRGLIRTPPRTFDAAALQPEAPQGTENLARGAKISVDASHAMTGDHGALIDGRRGDGVRIGGPAQQHYTLRAELDLGGAHLVEAVYLWLPGGKGVESGHVHDVKLAISPSADKLDFQAPAGLLINPVRPLDDAPNPYAITAGGLNAPGRRVRVEAYVSGTGGITSNLALGEIEVWGRPLEGSVPEVAHLELRPVTIDPDPVGDLSPKWQRLRDRRIRGTWIGGDLDQPFGDTDKTRGDVLAEAGFNTVVIYTGVDRENRDTAPELEDRIRRNVAAAHERGMLLLAKWQYGTSHQEPYRRFRGANGVEHEKSSCPLQPEYVERHVGRWAVAAAELGADGFTFDTEMYESDGTHYPGACYCDSCFERYLRSYSTDFQEHYESITPQRRGAWIEANGAKVHYAQDQRLALIGLFDDIRQRARAVNPDFLLAYAPFVGYLSGITHGLGDSSKPVIVWSEREYTHGPESRTVTYLDRVRDQGLPVLYAAGHMIWYQDPQTLTDNALEAALYTDGWWAWYGGALVNQPGLDDPEAFKSPYGRVRGFTAMQYLDAIKAMHARLDALLAKSPDAWPKSDVLAAPTAPAPAAGAAGEAELNLRPVAFEPEPVGEVHPKLRKMVGEKIRCAWIGDDLFDKFEGTEKTKAEILVDAGFNLVRVTMGVDREQRDTSPDLVERLPANVAEARRVGLPLVIGWQYGTSQQEPYRRFRSAGDLAERSACPLDADFIERHVARWAVAIAEGGADGMLIDTEMYESDQTSYPGACVCDACFRVYVDEFSSDAEGIFDRVPAERRGAWLAGREAGDHYAQHFARRIAEQYDGIRQRCAAMNPAFFFIHAPLLGHLPGLEWGLGTSTVPCLVFSEREYTNGPSKQSLSNLELVRRQGIPALYLPGAFTVAQDPDMVEYHALISSLYCDGWWLYYASSILNHPEADDPEAFVVSYGRVKGTSARDYLDRITDVHERVDALLGQPRNQWPRLKELPEMPTADVPRRAGPLSIDGRLDDPAWKRAGRLDLALSRWGEKTGPPTTVWTCWDDGALYVAARCRLPRGAELSVPQRGRDNADLWQFDAVEIFLDPGASRSRYAHLVISALGDVCDSLVDVEAGGDGFGNPSWNLDLEVATSRGDGEFRIEARIPFEGLGPLPAAGDAWAANFCRFRPGEHAWSPTYAGFHTSSRFGTLRFVDEAAP